MTMEIAMRFDKGGFKILGLTPMHRRRSGVPWTPVRQLTSEEIGEIFMLLATGEQAALMHRLLVLEGNNPIRLDKDDHSVANAINRILKKGPPIKGKRYIILQASETLPRELLYHGQLFQVQKGAGGRKKAK